MSSLYLQRLVSNELILNHFYDIFICRIIIKLANNIKFTPDDVT